jgi:hypothetical protein
MHTAPRPPAPTRRFLGRLLLLAACGLLLAPPVFAQLPKMLSGSKSSDKEGGVKLNQSPVDRVKGELDGLLEQQKALAWTEGAGWDKELGVVRARITDLLAMRERWVVNAAPPAPARRLNQAGKLVVDPLARDHDEHENEDVGLGAAPKAEANEGPRPVPGAVDGGTTDGGSADAGAPHPGATDAGPPGPGPDAGQAPKTPPARTPPARAPPARAPPARTPRRIPIPRATRVWAPVGRWATRGWAPVGRWATRGWATAAWATAGHPRSRLQSRRRRRWTWCPTASSF